MAVVAAGVHFSGVLGREGQPRCLADGQRVHVRAEGDRLRPSVVKIRADRALPREKQRAAERGQDGFQVFGGLRQHTIQLGDAVQRHAVGSGHCLDSFLAAPVVRKVSSVITSISAANTAR